MGSRGSPQCGPTAHPTGVLPPFLPRPYSSPLRAPPPAPVGPPSSFCRIPMAHPTVPQGLPPIGLPPRSRAGVGFPTHSPITGVLGWVPENWAELGGTGAVPGGSCRETSQRGSWGQLREVVVRASGGAMMGAATGGRPWAQR